MSYYLTRREMVKSLAGFTLGAGLTALPLNSKAALNPLRRKAKVKVPPPGPKSLALLKEVKKYVGKSNYAGLYSIGLKSGEGPFIEDMDGNVYLDCLTAASSNILGYSHDEIAKAYYDNAVQLQHTTFGYTPNAPTVELAKRLVQIAPGDFSKKALIGLSGSDSNGGAIEAARKFTGKMGIISFYFAYHGSTGLSQAASGFRSLNDGIYDPMDPNFIKVPFPVTSKESERVLENIESILAFGKVGAIMVEIIQGDSGTLLPAPGFYRRLRELLDTYGALLIDDEVQSGMGRTGKWWACDHEGIVPDIIVLGKGLSAGYAPVSAIVGREEVLDALPPAAHVFTYMGHPPSVSTASRVIDIIKEKQLIDNASTLGARLLAGLKEAEKYSDVVVEARGRGFMIGIEIDVLKNPLASKIFAFRCVEKGVYFGYIGDKQRVIRVLPPLILNQEEADIIIQTVHEVAEEMYKGQIPQSTIERVKKYTLGW